MTKMGAGNNWDMQSQASHMTKMGRGGGQFSDMQSERSYMMKVDSRADLQSSASYMTRVEREEDGDSNPGSFITKASKMTREEHLNQMLVVVYYAFSKTSGS